MTESEKRAGCLAVGSAIVAGLLFSIVIGMRTRAHQKTNWPQTPATITRRWTEEWQRRNTNDDNDWRTDYYAKFTYTVNGQQFETQQKVTSALAQQAGQKVTVRYNPQQPGWAEIVGVNEAKYDHAIFIATAVALCSAGFMIWFVMLRRKRIAVVLLLTFAAVRANAQEKLLIVHADDLGMAHSVDAAAIKGLESGLITSASIMVPCPWLPEIAAYARTHPNADLGLHLTLTSEWKSFRWRPLTRLPSLVDAEGFFNARAAEAVARMDPKEAEAEVRAQIATAKAAGIHPTHLDSHMGTLDQTTRELLAVLMRVARDEKIPARISRARAGEVRPDDIVIDRIITIDTSVAAEHWTQWYSEQIRTIQPGVTEIVLHPAYDDAEMRAMTAHHPSWGAAWRQRDFDFFTSDAFRRLVRENGIRLVTWREVSALKRLRTSSPDSPRPASSPDR